MVTSEVSGCGRSEGHGCAILTWPLPFLDKDMKLQVDDLPSVTELARR